MHVDSLTIRSVLTSSASRARPSLAGCCARTGVVAVRTSGPPVGDVSVATDNDVLTTTVARERCQPQPISQTKVAFRRGEIQNSRAVHDLGAAHVGNSRWRRSSSGTNSAITSVQWPGVAVCDGARHQHSDTGLTIRSRRHPRRAPADGGVAPRLRRPAGFASTDVWPGDKEAISGRVPG